SAFHNLMVTAYYTVFSVFFRQTGHHVLVMREIQVDSPVKNSSGNGIIPQLNVYSFVVHVTHVLADGRNTGRERKWNREQHVFAGTFVPCNSTGQFSSE